MARRSSPHRGLEAALLQAAADLKSASATVVPPHVIAGTLGASKSIIKLSLERAQAHDAARPAAALAARSAARTHSAAAGASPTSNTGGKVRTVELVTNGRKTKIVSVRDTSATGQCAMIDTLSVVFSAQTLRDLAPLNRSSLGGTDEHHEDLILAFMETFQRIFGVAITGKLQGRRNYYLHSYAIGDGLGHIGIGGNNDTVQLHLDGKGCLTANEGWEQRLHDWLVKVAIEPRITRIDLAHDDFAGDVTPDHMFAAYHAGMFTNGGRPPRCELRGDWITPDGAGRTLYVGSRDNGLLYRCYEKGKEQGDVSHPWVRHEVQLGNKCRVIPLNSLIFPGQYFAGAYAALHPFADTQVRIQTERKTAEASYTHVVDVAKNQVGRAINLMMDVLKDPAKVVEALIRDGYPKAFRSYEADHTTPMRATGQLSDEVFFDHGAAIQQPLLLAKGGWMTVPARLLYGPEPQSKHYPFGI
ncbi:replication initiation factor domain-containing protein [Chitinimonas sp.]|uniref:replication initiation factor domain-containing protein n=1 Tax=Chitinimonas sp. TaxID=1934313 RepID=UPI002F92BEE1